MQEFKKVFCPKCGRTILNYLEGSGTEAVYRSICQRCKSQVTVFSAGKTVIIKELSVEININISVPSEPHDS